MDSSALIGVLSQGEEKARQLRAQLNEPTFEIELCKSLAQSLESSFQTAIYVATTNTSITGTQQYLLGSDSPPSGCSLSPRSDNSDQFKDQEQKEACKKRKSLPKWSSQVRVSLGGGIEGPLDDGHSWRKYGQKDILGAKYPRGYYRCTHRNSQGCPATKQVQRSDEDPSIFEVSYRGNHTCIEKHQKVQSSRKEPLMKQSSQDIPEHEKQQQQQPQQLLSLRASLKVKTEGLEAEVGQPVTPTPNSSSFSFPSTPVNCIHPQSNVLATSSTTFMLGNTSDSNYFSMPQFQMGNNIQNSELDLTEMISAATSGTNSPMVDMDFMLPPAEFDPNFHFDSSFF